MTHIPDGFVPLPVVSGFLEMVGPIYWNLNHTPPILAMRIERKHTNRGGYIHGGLLSAFADLVLANGCIYASAPPQQVVTVSLTIDYVGNAKIGAWLHGTADVQKASGRTMFANCYIKVEDERIARASGVFRKSPSKSDG